MKVLAIFRERSFWHGLLACLAVLSLAVAGACAPLCAAKGCAVSASSSAETAGVACHHEVDSGGLLQWQSSDSQACRSAYLPVAAIASDKTDLTFQTSVDNGKLVTLSGSTMANNSLHARSDTDFATDLFYGPTTGPTHGTVLRI